MLELRARLRPRGFGEPGGHPRDVPCARGRGDQCAHRCRRHRPHRGGRAPDHRIRPDPGVNCAWARRHRATHGRARARRQHQLGGVRTRQFRRGSDRSADRHPALSPGRLRPDLARPRPLAGRRHHLERRAAGTAGQCDRRHLPHHPRSRRGDDLCGGAAHRQAHPDLSVGARRLQGQDQLDHALPRHRHRNRGPLGAIPDHSVRGQGLGDVSRGRRARLGGAGLYRHRFRLLGQGVRHVDGHRADLARRRGGSAGSDIARFPVRLSES